MSVFSKFFHTLFQLARLPKSNCQYKCPLLIISYLMSATSMLRAANGPNKAHSLLQGQKVNIIIHASKNQIP